MNSYLDQITFQLFSLEAILIIYSNETLISAKTINYQFFTILSRSFYQRMILCNSLVWSCEISGKPNLTFKEAQESEKSIRKSLSTIPFSLKVGMLYCVHHTRRSKIQELTDEIFEYLKTRYQLDEKVEVKIKDKWYS